MPAVRVPVRTAATAALGTLSNPEKGWEGTERGSGRSGPAGALPGSRPPPRTHPTSSPQSQFSKAARPVLATLAHPVQPAPARPPPRLPASPPLGGLRVTGPGASPAPRAAGEWLKEPRRTGRTCVPFATGTNEPARGNNRAKERTRLRLGKRRAGLPPAAVPEPPPPGPGPQREGPWDSGLSLVLQSGLASASPPNKARPSTTNTLAPSLPPFP